MNHPNPHPPFGHLTRTLCFNGGGAIGPGTHRTDGLPQQGEGTSFSLSLLRERVGVRVINGKGVRLIDRGIFENVKPLRREWRTMCRHAEKNGWEWLNGARHFQKWLSACGCRFDALLDSPMRGELSQAALQTNRAEASSGDGFVANEMKTNNFWNTSKFKMAAHGIAYLFMKLGNRIRLSNNGSAGRLGNKATLGCFFNDEKNFAHNSVIIPRATGLKPSSALRAPHAHPMLQRRRCHRSRDTSDRWSPSAGRRVFSDARTTFSLSLLRERVGVRVSLSVLCFLFFALPCSAATRYWIATGGATNWNNTSNWATTSGGGSGASVPGAGDTARFDSNGTANCNIDITASVSTLIVNAGYTGTIDTQNNGVTLSADLVVNAGTFSAGASTVTVAGMVDFRGGKFTKGTSNFTLNGAGSQTVYSSSAAYFRLEDDNTSAAGVSFQDSITASTFTATQGGELISFQPSPSSMTVHGIFSGQWPIHQFAHHVAKQPGRQRVEIETLGRRGASCFQCRDTRFERKCRVAN